MLEELRISESTVTFKFNLCRLLKKFPSLQSTKFMYYFKKYLSQIKLICRISGNKLKNLAEQKFLLEISEQLFLFTALKFETFLPIAA